MDNIIKISIKMIMALLLIFQLLGCSNLEIGSPILSEKPYPNEEILLSEDDLLETQRTIISNGDTFSVSFNPREDMPELTVSFILVGEWFRDPSPTRYYYLCTISHADKKYQSFEIELIEILNPEFIDFVDIDFDDYLDMEIISFSQSTNWPFTYYRYNLENNIFDETPFFRTNGRGVKLFPDTKQMIVTILDAGAPCEREIYQYADGEYILARKENISRDYKTETYDVNIVEHDKDGEWTEIYSAILTKDEYFGDITTLDNYLRFGKGDHP